MTYKEFKEAADEALDRLEDLYKEELRPIEGQRNLFDLSAEIFNGYLMTVRAKVRQLGEHADLFEKQERR